MRIITGKFRGRTISSLPGKSLRPATDKVRGSIFNILQNRLNLTGIHILDLFAGTGSLGFEAISRGAGRVVFVENDERSMEVIRSNAVSLSCLEMAEFHRRDAMEYITTAAESFSLIFADPPYAYTDVSSIPALVMARGLLDPDGYLIIEHRRGTEFPGIEKSLVSFQRPFGHTNVSFFHPNGIGAEHS